MTTEYSLTALTQILSALDGQKRNPCTKKAAIKAINKKADALELHPDEIFNAADDLLSGKVADSDFLGVLLADPNAPASTTRMMPNGAMMMVPTKPVADEDADAPAEAHIETEEEQAEPEAEGPVEPEAEENDPEAAAPKRSRENSKQARMIEMMRRPEGATIEQIAEEMGWQKHTVRGAISGALKKKLGLNITSGKIDGRRTYRIED